MALCCAPCLLLLLLLLLLALQRLPSSTWLGPVLWGPQQAAAGLGAWCCRYP
jgi:hypothetical protein